MSLMDANKDQIYELIKLANEITGESNTDLTSAVNSLVTGYKQDYEEILYSEYGIGYTANMVLDSERIIGGAWNDSNELISLELTNWNPVSSSDMQFVSGTSGNDTFQSTSLKTLILPKLQYGGHYWARYATALEKVQLGSIGFPVTSLGNYFFYGDTQENLEITVYVNAKTLSTITSNVKGTAPWGARNATVIYRNSDTGEIITQS